MPVASNPPYLERSHNQNQKGVFLKSLLSLHGRTCQVTRFRDCEDAQDRKPALGQRQQLRVKAKRSLGLQLPNPSNPSNPCTVAPCDPCHLAALLNRSEAVTGSVSGQVKHARLTQQKL